MLGERPPVSLESGGWPAYDGRLNSERWETLGYEEAMLDVMTKGGVSVLTQLRRTGGIGFKNVALFAGALLGPLANSARADTFMDFTDEFAPCWLLYIVLLSVVARLSATRKHQRLRWYRTVIFGLLVLPFIAVFHGYWYLTGPHGEYFLFTGSKATTFIILLVVASSVLLSFIHRYFIIAAIVFNACGVLVCGKFMTMMFGLDYVWGQALGTVGFLVMLFLSIAIVREHKKPLLETPTLGEPRSPQT
jgi:hypothetical protein